MAQEIQKDILKEEPLDWVKNKVHRGLYSKPFAWKKSAPCTSTYNDIQVQLRVQLLNYVLKASVVWLPLEYRF